MKKLIWLLLCSIIYTACSPSIYTVYTKAEYITGTDTLNFYQPRKLIVTKDTAYILQKMPIHTAKTKAK